MLSWLKQFSTFAFLNSNEYYDELHRAELLVGAGIGEKGSIEGPSVEGLQQFIDEHTGQWIFGHMSYDLKNVIEPLSSTLPDPIGFPVFSFFIPQVVIYLKQDSVTIMAKEPEFIWHSIQEQPIIDEGIPIKKIDSVIDGLDQHSYIEKITRIQEHIHKGDCYELNFCIPFYAKDVKIDPFLVFTKLNSLSPHPFSALYRQGDKWLISASPERFLRKVANRLISQPMKGTKRRTTQPASQAMKELKEDAKEQSENVMVVDMVRNDLSRICKPGSVTVTELYGVYPFPQVFQMISTIEGELELEVGFLDIIKAMFPMGSMTGAPKIKVMELIEKYEMVRRGLFSGSVGYFAPNGDFDFNVVIRSILYNAKNQILQYEVGSAITGYSIPKKEWEECLLKSEAIRSVLSFRSIF